MVITQEIKAKILNTALILSSLIGYLEWGHQHSEFLFQVELELIFKLSSNPGSVLHPFVILPLLGQAILLCTLFQKSPSKILTIVGLSCIGVLLVFMFTVGIISFNIKIIGSTLPFIVTSIITIKHHRKNKIIVNSSN